MEYIIMCGGTYPKFKTPKQLLKVNGEVLVERTIRLLRENDITDIAVSTNDERFNYLDVELLHDKDNQFLYWGENENKLSKNSWLRAYYPVNEPVCYLHGDVYFSDEAIKTIVETPVKDTMFFCVADYQDIPNKDIRSAGGREPLAYKVENYKLFRDAVDDLLKMVDEGKFKNSFCGAISWNVYRYLNGLDLGFNAKWYGDINDIFKSKGNYIIINDYTNDVDDEKDVAKIEKYLKYKEGNMIKVEAIQDFTLGRFGELKNIKRKNIDTPGKLYKGDVFECTEPMADYLTGGNSKKKVVVRVLEILPKVEDISPKDTADESEKIIPLDEENIKVIAEQINKAVKKTTKKKKSKK